MSVFHHFNRSACLLLFIDVVGILLVRTYMMEIIKNEKNSYGNLKGVNIYYECFRQGMHSNSYVKSMYMIDHTFNDWALGKKEEFKQELSKLVKNYTSLSKQNQLYTDFYAVLNAIWDHDLDAFEAKKHGFE